MISSFSQMAGLSAGRMQRRVLAVLRLHVPEVVPGLLGDLRTHEDVEHGHGLHLGAGDHAFVRDRRRHRNRVRPVVTRPGLEVRRKAQRHGRHIPGDVADVVGPAAALFSSSGIDSRPRSSRISVASPTSGTFSSRCSALASVTSASVHFGSPTDDDVLVHRLGKRAIHVRRPRRSEHARLAPSCRSSSPRLWRCRRRSSTCA